MKNALKNGMLLCAAALLIVARAHADEPSLRLNGDLMVHPDQIVSFLKLAANKIKTSPTWDWPSLSLNQPYKTTWTNLQAQGPFDIQFDPTTVTDQNLTFTLTWTQPVIRVGGFEIHDTVTRDVGGAHIILHLDGRCSNMSLAIPGGQWVVKGQLHWDTTAQNFNVQWQGFNFQMNTGAVTQLSLGECQGPPGLIQALRDAIENITRDQSWLQDVLKAGVLDWAQSTMNELHTQLLAARKVSIKEGVLATWQPSQLSAVAGGLMRVSGQFVVTKVGATAGEEVVDRTYDDFSLTQVTESGFILPQNSLQKIMDYLFTTGELQYRLKSTEVASFQSLMKSRFMQFFVWPDLMQFKKTTEFYFDVGTEKSPAMGEGTVLSGGGSSYPFEAPMLAHQWAPTKAAYVPYVDFRAKLKGRLTAVVKDGHLTLAMHDEGDLKLKATFRKEFAKLRTVNPWIAVGMIGSRLQDYFNTLKYSVATPSWPAGPGFSLEMRDVQAWKQSLRIPLQFQQPTP